VRYLALSPLGVLAHAGDGTAAARIADAVAHDADWPVRVRAAELGVGLAEAQPALMSAVRDSEPRVREAALQALSSAPVAAAVEVARGALTKDGWPFVKVQAAHVLAHAPPSAEVDEVLRTALGDASSNVRMAALVAVALRHARTLHGAVRDRLDDVKEEAEVRAGAAAALGALCDASSTDRLTELARAVGVPGTSEDDQTIGEGALKGLAALHPVDLGKRLAPLLSPSASPLARAAGETAMAARGVCP
jgi:HEAT repeat protein